MKNITLMNKSVLTSRDCWFNWWTGFWVTISSDPLWIGSQDWIDRIPWPPYQSSPEKGEENWWIQSNQARFCLIMAEDFVTVWSLFIILFFIFHHILLIYKFPYSIFWLIDAVDQSKFTKASEHRGFTSSVEGGSSRLDGGVLDLSEDILMIYDIWRWWRGLMKRIDDEYMLLLCRHLSSSSRVNIYLFIYILYTSVCVFVCLCVSRPTLGKQLALEAGPGMVLWVGEGIGDIYRKVLEILCDPKWWSLLSFRLWK